MTAALSISHLRTVYRRGTVAVQDLSMTIAEADFFGFLEGLLRGFSRYSGDVYLGFPGFPRVHSVGVNCMGEA